MKKLFGISAIALSLMLSACTTFVPLSAGSGTVGAKRGESVARTLFGFIPLSSDNTMLKAAQDGGIEHIATVDLKYFTFFGLYSSKTTIVTGD